MMKNSAAAAATNSATNTIIPTPKRLLQKITFLGTSSGVPTPDRNVSSYGVTFTDGSWFMFDCGEGAQHRLQQCPGVSLGRLERIFITHLHGDHCYGLPGLMCSLAMTWGKKDAVVNNKKTPTTAEQEAENEDEDEGEMRTTNEQDRYTALKFKPFLPNSEYLEIVGPEKLGEYLRAVLKASEAFLPFKYRVTELLNSANNFSYEEKQKKLMAADPEHLHWCEAPPIFVRPEISENTDKDCFYPNFIEKTNKDTSTIGISVSAAPLRHPVFCIGYTLTEPLSPGTLNMELISKLGVPKGPLLSKLKNGHDVTFPAPKPKQEEKTESTTSADEPPKMITVTSAQVVSDPIPGRTILCLGDTCNSDQCINILPPPESGLLEAVVHEATFDDSNQALAEPRGHSTSRQAGEFAGRVGARKLILTHFSARFLPPKKDPEPVRVLIAEAKKGFEQGINERVDGKNDFIVEAACDFDSFELIRKKK